MLADGTVRSSRRVRITHVSLIEKLQNNPPKFHHWGGEDRIGGFGPKQLDLLKDCVELVDSGSPVRCLETGAGLSTTWLLGHGAELHSFFINQKLGDDITTYFQENGHAGLLDSWTSTVGPSELTLPAFANTQPVLLFDFCLIDGGHGLHTVFTDFTYQYYLLRKGGILLLDDVQLGSCGLLHELLKAEDSFEYVADAKKLVAFRKTTDRRFLPDHGGQKFLDPLLKAIQSQ